MVLAASVIVQDADLGTFVEQLEAGTPFAFSRWGDGEWRALLGYAGENCDGHPYSGALREHLTRVLESRPTYGVGLQPLAVRTVGKEIAQWLSRRGIELAWMNADVFHQASIEDRLAPLIAALRKRHVLLVGPRYLNALTLFPSAKLAVPERNCFAHYPEILQQVQQLLHYAKGPLVVSVSAGMTANILIDALHRDYPAHTFLDAGSLWEPYVGRATRKYHHAIVKRLEQTTEVEA